MMIPLLIALETLLSNGQSLASRTREEIALWDEDCIPIEARLLPKTGHFEVRVECEDAPSPALSLEFDREGTLLRVTDLAG